MMNDLDEWIKKTGYLCEVPKGFTYWSDWIASNPINPPDGFKNWQEWDAFLDSIDDKIHSYYNKKYENHKSGYIKTEWCRLYVTELRCNIHISVLCTRDNKELINIKNDEAIDILSKGKEFVSTMNPTTKTIKWIALHENEARSIKKWINNDIKASETKVQLILSDYLENTKPFDYDIERSLHELLIKDTITDIEFDIYSKISLKMQSANDILKSSIDFDSIYEIKKIYEKVKGALNDYIGEKYESWIFPILKLKYKNVEHDGRSGKSDFRFNDEDNTKCFMSVKCFEFAKDYNLSIDEHDAEINEAKEYYNKYKTIPRVIVHVYNRYTNKITEIDLPSYIITGEIEKSTKIKV